MSLLGTPPLSPIFLRISSLQSAPPLNLASQGLQTHLENNPPTALRILCPQNTPPLSLIFLRILSLQNTPPLSVAPQGLHPLLETWSKQKPQRREEMHLAHLSPETIQAPLLGADTVAQRFLTTLLSVTSAAAHFATTLSLRANVAVITVIFCVIMVIIRCTIKNVGINTPMFYITSARLSTTLLPLAFAAVKFTITR